MRESPCTVAAEYEELVRQLLQRKGRPVLLGSRPPQNLLQKLRASRDLREAHRVAPGRRSHVDSSRHGRGLCIREFAHHLRGPHRAPEHRSCQAAGAELESLQGHQALGAESGSDNFSSNSSQEGRGSVPLLHRRLCGDIGPSHMEQGVCRGHNISSSRTRIANTPASTSNQGDWMLDTRSWDEPFDWRATPPLHAERRNQVPLGPKRLLRNMKPVNFSGMRTRELKQHCRKQGFRLLSRQHMPEALNPGHFTRHDYSDNLTICTRFFGLWGIGSEFARAGTRKPWPDCDLDFRHTCVPARWRSP